MVCFFHRAPYSHYLLQFTGGKTSAVMNMSMGLPVPDRLYTIPLSAQQTLNNQFNGIILG